MNSFLLEIGTEEIPAKSIDLAVLWIKSETIEVSDKLGVKFECIETYGTPRRLVLILNEIKKIKTDVVTEIRGPRKKVALYENNKLTTAGTMFLKSKNAKKKDIIIKEYKNEEFVVIRVKNKQKSCEAILEELALHLLKKMPFQKAMRWESTGATFVRPVRWILAIFNEKIVKINFAGIRSSNKTYGHRFLFPKLKKINSVAEYKEYIEKSYVILDSKKRSELIRQKVALLSKSINGIADADEELLGTVKNLVEYPWPIIGFFDKSFLDMPKEILVSEMSEHQKCFSITAKKGNLLPAAIIISGTRPTTEKTFAAGNMRVLSARFKDGEYYYKEDSKINIRDNLYKLRDFVFYQNLGSMLDKTIRIQNLSLAIAKTLNFKKKQIKHVLRTAKLSKIDLTSGVVSEFPKLQGIMGGIYAKQSEESEGVVNGITEHYMPRFSGDNLPQGDEGSIISISDKLDTIINMINIDKAPKGRMDPFGLRRAAISLIKIILNKKYNIEISTLIDHALSLISNAKNETKSNASEFIKSRIKWIYLDSDETELTAAKAIIDAVIGSKSDRVIETDAKIRALISFYTKSRDGFFDFVLVIKRVNNIVKKSENKGIFNRDTKPNIELLETKIEKQLLKRINELEECEKLSNIKNDYSDMVTKITELRNPLDLFFNEIKVINANLELQNARLSLLSSMLFQISKIADFSLFAVSENENRDRDF